MTAAMWPLEEMAMARAATWTTMAAVLALAATAAALAWWWRASEWPIAVVRIDGEARHADRDRLKAIVARHARAGFFGLELAALRTEIEALPWVRAANLRRVWPDTLRVTVDEHEAAAVWNGSALISRRGTVFRPQQLDPEGMPRLRGPNGRASRVLARLRRFRQRLAPLGLAIAALERDARRAWRIELGNGISLRLGRQHVDERLARFAAVWPRVLAPEAGRIAAVDLRYPNGFAVAWHDDAGGAGGNGREGGR